jgi:hypothetical protein
MTVEEMAERIVETVGGIGGGVTFAEIVNAVGEEAKGDGQLGWPDLNVVLWTDVSESSSRLSISQRNGFSRFRRSFLLTQWTECS